MSQDGPATFRVRTLWRTLVEPRQDLLEDDREPLGELSAFFLGALILKLVYRAFTAYAGCSLQDDNALRRFAPCHSEALMACCGRFAVAVSPPAFARTLYEYILVQDRDTWIGTFPQRSSFLVLVVKIGALIWFFIRLDGRSPPPRYLVHIAFPLTYTMLIYEYMKTLKRLDMCTAVSTLIVYLIVTELHGWQVYYLKGPGKKGPRLGYIAIIGYAVMVVDVCIIDDIVHPVLGTLLVRTPLLRHWDDERIMLVGHILDLRREACPWIIANPPRRWRNFDSNESIVDMCARLEMDDEKHQSVSRWRRWFWSHEEVDARDVAEAKKQLYGMIVDHQDLPSLASYSQGRTQVDLFQSNSAQPASSLDRHRMIPLRSIEPVFVSEEMILDQIIDAVCSYAVSVILTLRPFVNSATVTAWAEDMKFNRNGDLILHISLLQWLAFPWGPKFSILSRSRSFDFQGSLFDMKARLL